MIWRLRIGRWRFTFTMARTVDVVGVNSLLPDGSHILMWDFDDVNLWDVREALETTQRVYELPNIYILTSGKPKSFIAYCFKSVEWRRAVEIIAYTKGVDWGFFKWAVYRGRFTLRVTPKCGRKPYLIEVLKSPTPETVFIDRLRSWVKYETLEDGQEVKVHELKVF